MLKKLNILCNSSRWLRFSLVPSLHFPGQEYDVLSPFPCLWYIGLSVFSLHCSLFSVHIYSLKYALEPCHLCPLVGDYYFVTYPWAYLGQACPRRSLCPHLSLAFNYVQVGKIPAILSSKLSLVDHSWPCACQWGICVLSLVTGSMGQYPTDSLSSQLSLVSSHSHVCIYETPLLPCCLSGHR